MPRDLSHPQGQHEECLELLALLKRKEKIEMLTRVLIILAEVGAVVGESFLINWTVGIDAQAKIAIDALISSCTSLPSSWMEVCGNTTSQRFYESHCDRNLLEQSQKLKCTLVPVGAIGGALGGLALVMIPVLLKCLIDVDRSLTQRTQELLNLATPPATHKEAITVLSEKKSELENDHPWLQSQSVATPLLQHQNEDQHRQSLCTKVTGWASSCCSFFGCKSKQSESAGIDLESNLQYRYQ